MIIAIEPSIHQAPATSLFSEHKLPASCKLQLSVSICEDKPPHYARSVNWRRHTVSSEMFSTHFAVSVHFLWGRGPVLRTHILEQIAERLCQSASPNRGFWPNQSILWETNWLWPDIPWSLLSRKRQGRLPLWKAPFLRTEQTLQSLPRKWAKGQKPVSVLGNAGVRRPQQRGQASQRKGTVQGTLLSAVIFLGHHIV